MWHTSDGRTGRSWEAEVVVGEAMDSCHSTPVPLTGLAALAALCLGAPHFLRSLPVLARRLISFVILETLLSSYYTLAFSSFSLLEAL